MKEQAGVEPGPQAFVSQSEVESFEVASLVVPPQQRLAMPVQRLEALSLSRLFGAPATLAPARIAAPSAATDDR